MSDAPKQDAQFDPIVEDETRRGFRVKAVPPQLQAQVRDEGLAPFSHIRMARLNPSRRRKITEVSQRAYHKDLRDTDLLSNEQVMKLVVERGEWSAAMDKRLTELQQRTTSQMASLYNEGVTKSREWVAELGAKMGRFEELVDTSDLSVDEKGELHARFRRWADYRPEKQAAYVTAHPEALRDGVYYPDSDMNWLMEHAPTLEGADLVEDIQTLQDRVQEYLTLVAERTEFEELRLKRLRIFANTVESRRENAEEMARVYFATERCDADGNVQGPLSFTFDALYDLPDDMISWLIEEQFFFQNGIPDETREFLSAFGFLTAAPEPKDEPAPPPAPTSGEPGSSAPSDASAAVPTASIASPPSAAMPATSSA